jgi:hypothetical protein
VFADKRCGFAPPSLLLWLILVINAALLGYLVAQVQFASATVTRTNAIEAEARELLIETEKLLGRLRKESRVESRSLQPMWRDRAGQVSSL